MQDFVVVLLLLLPVVIVVFILSSNHKKQKKKKEQKHLAYINQVLEQNQIAVSYRKDLADQLLVIDEGSKKLLVIAHSDDSYNHHLYTIDDLKTLRLFKFTQSLTNGESSGKSETFVTQIGLELVPAKASQAEQLLVFYDHVHHSIYMMAELEREAKRMQDRIRQLMNNKLAAA